jgi:3-hydroxyisobutyrate dehydrogenase
MGGGMARRVLGAGFPLTVYNRDTAKAEPLAAAGAKVAATPREAAAQADIVISMVSDDAVSRAIWLGENGALAGARRGAILIESSTLTVSWVRELAAAAAKQGCDFLDAPVTGSKPHAQNGELLFLVGGDAAALEKARPVLAVMSRGIVYLGPVGSGALMKLINNFLCGVQAASLAEADALIVAGGLDKEKAMGVLTNGAPGSPLVKTLSARAMAGDLKPNFFLRLMAKDLSYAHDEAEKKRIDLRTAAAAEEIFRHAVKSGRGDQDFAAVIGSVTRG